MNVSRQKNSNGGLMLQNNLPERMMRFSKIGFRYLRWFLAQNDAFGFRSWFSKLCCPKADSVTTNHESFRKFTAPSSIAGSAASNLTASRVKISGFKRFEMLNINELAGRDFPFVFLQSFFCHLLKLILVEKLGIGKVMQGRAAPPFEYTMPFTNLKIWYTHVRRRPFDAKRTPSR